MTHNIVKFESGFYGLKVISTGEIIDAALKKWDGKNGTNYPYEIISETFEYYRTRKTMFTIPAKTALTRVSGALVTSSMRIVTI